MAKIRPIESKDIRECVAAVTTPLSRAKVFKDASLESESIFGSMERSKDSPYDLSDIYSRKAYIPLTIPVLNFFLAGEDAGILSIILDKDIKSIANGGLLLDTRTNKVLDAKSIGNQEHYNQDILIGGEYIKYLINNFSVEDAINKMLTTIVKKAYKKLKVDEEDIGNVNIEYGSGMLHIVDEYYYTPQIEVSTEVLKEHIDKQVQERLLQYNSRLTYLLSIRENKDRIRNQVMENIIVLPYGYRKRYKNMVDGITKAYDRILRENIELQNLLIRENASLKTVREHYQSLVHAVRNLMVVKTNRFDAQYKPIFEILKGKEGFIRDKMQGARIDYSGRSVITVDPEMSIDTMGIPKAIIEKLLECDIARKYGTRSTNKSDIVADPKMEPLKKNLAQTAVNDAVIVSGRQPTLYQLGLRGFKIKPVDGDAITLSPLICPAYNADFDGDQMHVEAVVEHNAKEEVKKLLGVKNNLFYPRSGDCIIAPRMEIIHGLWKASVATVNSTSKKYEYERNDDSLIEDVCKQKINIWDEVTVDGVTETAGKAAIRMCLPGACRSVRLGVLPITYQSGVPEAPVKENFFAALNKEIVKLDKGKFVATTNKLVKLGFAITNIFPPSIPVVNHIDVRQLIDDFDKKVAERERYYNMGLETQVAYTTFYNDAYNALNKEMKKYIAKELPDSSGYVEMIQSGARGNISNMQQVFGMKGRIMKNKTEVFNITINHSFVDQLTGLEHLVSAYGGRQGLIDKSIQTYGPGYLSRQMSHVTSAMYITNIDCGTKEGLLLDYDFIRQFMNYETMSGDDIIDNASVKSYLSKILVGRYIVGAVSEIKDIEEADKIYDMFVAEVSHGKFLKKGGVKLRSPLTCQNPCCSKCYGRDLGTQSFAAVGLPIGFIASQSIGEPGTQLTMKNFQSGGVAGVKNLTSSFELMTKYINLTKFRQDPSEPITYDFVSPVEGYTDVVYHGDGTKTLKICNIDENGKWKNLLGTKKIKLYEGIKLKEYVKRGESIQLIQGDLDVQELMECVGVKYARKYLAMKVYDIFQKEVYVSLKHFEVLVTMMTFYVCIKGNEYFKTGLFYTTLEYYGHDRSGCEFTSTIIGSKKVPLYRKDVFSTIFMENIKKGIDRSIILSGEDEMKLPITRYSFGLKLEGGSSENGYIENRGGL